MNLRHREVERLRAGCNFSLLILESSLYAQDTMHVSMLWFNVCVQVSEHSSLLRNPIQSDHLKNTTGEAANFSMQSDAVDD